tara:strand:+ start:44 stop:1831 length:1788 start_codon:yes stop_codon:yes gene_type:complete
MAILHKNITNSADIHNPKWHPDANNGDYAWRNEKGELESLDELLLPAALNFVDGSVAPPTSNNNDIYVLSSGGSVNGGWGSVSLQDWVRYDGSVWYAITPQKSSLCYDKTADSLMSFNGTAWAAIGSGGGGGNTIYTSDDTIGSGRVATITDTLTLAGGKLVLSSVNDGVLLNRVDDSQMAAISADTNEIVFNTDKEVLYRWSGSAWVALAAGFGIVGTTDVTGKPTFYATVKAAYIAGQGSIKLYSDVTETSANTISIVSGRDIDLNGYTYTYDVADSSDVFEDNTSANTFRVINGRIIRKNATGGFVFNLDLIQTQIDVINVYVESENQKVLSVRGTFNGFGSTFVSNNSSGAGVYFGSFAIVTGGKYIQKNNGSNQTIGSELKNVEWICEGSGQNTIGGNLFNCRLIGNTGKGAYTGGLTKIYDCYIYSLSGNAIDLRAGSEVYNSTMISDASVCVATGGVNTKLFGCNISGSNSLHSVNNISFIEDCVITNTNTVTGKAIEIYQESKIINNTITINSANNAIRVNSAGADSILLNNNIFITDSTKAGVQSSNFDAYIAGNDIKGSTNVFDLGTGSNLWTATKDSQGNSGQL